MVSEDLSDYFVLLPIMLLFTNKFNHITAEIAEPRYDITFSLREGSVE